MKKSIASIIIFSLILASCGKSEEIVEDIPKPKKEVKTLITKKAPITEQIKLIWKVSWDKETVISSQISWLVNMVNVKLWDAINKDSILATIDTNSAIWINFNNASIALNNSSSIYGYTSESVSKDIESAKLQLENAKIARNNVYATTDKQLSISKKQVDNIKTTQSWTLTANAESIKNAELWVQLSTKAYNTALLNLENFNKNKEKTLATLYDNLPLSIDSSYINIETAIKQADFILWVTEKNKYDNDSFETYLWAKKTMYKFDAENLLREVISKYDEISSKDYGNSSESNMKKANDLISVLTKTVNLYQKLWDTLNYSLSSNSFPQTTIDSLVKVCSWIEASILQSKSQLLSTYNTISSTTTNLETWEASLNNASDIALTNLESAKQNLALLKSNLNINTTNLSWNISIAEDQLDSTNVNIKANRESADNAVKIAEAGLNSALAKLNVGLVQSKSSLDSIKWQKDLASLQLNNSVIKAPFAGAVVSKNVEIWTLVNPWTPLFTVSWNENLKIKLEVPSETISHLKEWSEVNLELTNKQTSTWKISLINKTANPQTNLFQVEITFDKNKFKAKVWEYVVVYINKKTSEKDWIMLPFETILNPSDWVYTVFVLSWSTVKKTEVKLWLKNSTQVEITNWLKPWEEVVLTKVSELEDLEEVEISK